MRRWIGLAARLYPREWRVEFEEEFGAVLDDVRPSWRVFGDVLKGAIEMRMAHGRSWTKVVAAMAVAGALVGFGVSYRVAPMYVSSAMIRVTPVADPVRPAPAVVLRERAMQQVGEIQLELLSRWELSTVIRESRLHLYQQDLKSRPLAEVIDEMRHNIRVTMAPPAKGGPVSIALNISFSYRDAAEARATVGALASKFLELNQKKSQRHDEIYREFWGDIAPVEHLKSVPPPPPGDIAEVTAAPSAPVKTEPNRFVFLMWGLGAGTLVGFLAVFVTRWPRQTRDIAAFAAAGCVMAFVISLLIPNRYTSTAIMRLGPAVLTENPLASPSAVTSNAEFLRRVEPEILSSQNLATIIEDRRLELYGGERARKSMEEVIQEMRANLSIVPVARDSGFSISFTYYDRFKAQQTVSTIMGRFEELNQERQRAEMPGMSFRQRVITQRKAGEVLDVLDIASLPMVPVFPNRWIFAAVGFGLGVLIGAITLRSRGGTFREFRVGRKPDGRPEGPPHVALLQFKVDGADHGFRAG